MSKAESDRAHDFAIDRRELLRYTAGGALSAVLLAACGSSSPSSSSGSGASSANTATSGSVGPSVYSFGPPQGGTPKPGGTLRVGAVTNGSAETLSPLLAAVPADIIRVTAIFDNLWFAGPHSTVRPALATDWSSNAKASVWKVRLREGVHWHDGKPFTADDVVYTIQKSWGSPHNTWNSLFSQVIDFKGVRKLDPLTVEIPLYFGVADWPTTTCVQGGAIVQNGATNFNQPVGTGPFVYGSFHPGQSSTMNSNKDYWDEAPHIDSLVVVSSFTDPNTIMSALLSGQIDILPAAPSALAQSSAASGAIFMGNMPGPGWCSAQARVDIPPFNDPNVIGAFKLMTNRTELTRSVWDGYGTPGNDCPGATDRYWASDLTYTYDPEQAKALLKQVGKENMQITLQTAAAAPGMNETATVFAQQATASGVTVNVKVETPSFFFSAAQYLHRPFGMDEWTNGVSSLALFYLSNLWAHAPLNETGWGTNNHQSSNALLLDALAETNPTLATDKWHAVQELQHKSGGMLIQTNYNWVDAYAKNVRGVQTTNAGFCNNFIFSGAWFE